MPLHAPEMRAVRVAGFGGAVAALIEKVLARRYFWGESDGN